MITVIQCTTQSKENLMSRTPEACSLCANPTYAQTVTRLAREWNTSAVGGRVSRQVAAATFGQLEDAAERAGISQDDATDDLYDEIDADGPGAR